MSTRRFATPACANLSGIATDEQLEIELSIVNTLLDSEDIVGLFTDTADTEDSVDTVDTTDSEFDIADSVETVDTADSVELDLALT